MKNLFSICLPFVFLFFYLYAYAVQQHNVTLFFFFRNNAFLYYVFFLDLLYQCLRLLEIAFDRRLTFTVGTSATSGADNCVTWNNIHHKTVANDHGGGHGHGFPDQGYMDNLIEELKNIGVTENDV